jgi:hypothetical protein
VPGFTISVGPVRGFLPGEYEGERPGGDEHALMPFTVVYVICGVSCGIGKGVQ